MTSSFQAKEKNPRTLRGKSSAGRGEEKWQCKCDASTTNPCRPIAIPPVNLRPADRSGIRRACRERPFRLYYNRKHGFRTGVSQDETNQGHARDIIVPSTGHTLQQMHGPILQMRFYKPDIPPNVSTHTTHNSGHTQNEYLHTSRVYKNGEHNEILGRCVRTRIETLSPGINGFANSNLKSIWQAYFYFRLSGNSKRIDAHPSLFGPREFTIERRLIAMYARNARALAVRWLLLQLLIAATTTNHGGRRRKVERWNKKRNADATTYFFLSMSVKLSNAKGKKRTYYLTINTT